MNTRYNKHLGRTGQKKVRDIILEHYDGLLEEGDIRSCPTSSQGNDLILSPKAQAVFPFDVEVKYGKSFNLIRANQQAEKYGKYTPLSVGCYRLEKPEQFYVCLKIEDFFDLLVYYDN